MKNRNTVPVVFVGWQITPWEIMSADRMGDQNCIIGSILVDHLNPEQYLVSLTELIVITRKRYSVTSFNRSFQACRGKTFEWRERKTNVNKR